MEPPVAVIISSIDSLRVIFLNVFVASGRYIVICVKFVSVLFTSEAKTGKQYSTVFILVAIVSSES